MSAVTPLRDLVYVEKLDVGRERVTPGGIIIPATTGGSARTRSDLWRGRVLAVGPKAEARVGKDVLVYTYAGGSGEKLYTGEDGGGAYRTFIGPDDIVCEVEPDAEVAW